MQAAYEFGSQGTLIIAATLVLCLTPGRYIHVVVYALRVNFPSPFFVHNFLSFIRFYLASVRVLTGTLGSSFDWSDAKRSTATRVRFPRVLIILLINGHHPQFFITPQKRHSTY
ncbi:uncharacterized protein BKA55DRAFT_168209 [Fusarium redolens]|uniref:Uncharacterized protein n=1 Tax=Fusarium redolens TaxID=48865 RepID=A0A9P9KRH6_FUSRE|nr:uncharacterized protein BKA55DRAFT_168209 [Fusarium redolens]KAH7267193.1 hypothetical protein BKA55DRAFT_168209 [Fusarium redolens]